MGDGMVLDVLLCPLAPNSAVERGANFPYDLFADPPQASVIHNIHAFRVFHVLYNDLTT